MVARGRTKCMKKGENAVIDDLEQQVSQAMIDLENNSDIKEQLRPLYFIKAKEFQVGSRSAVVVWVPVPLIKQYRLVQQRLTRELEKKFSGKHVIFLAWRRILPKPMRGKSRRVEKQKRPRSRTLTSVHEAMLSDLVYPAEIVGKRTRIKLDGKRLVKIHLDKAQMTNVEHKTDTFVGIYKKLTGKDVNFEFPESIFEK